MRGAVREQARSVVRVLDRFGEVVGAGFLIGPDLVATCAHVVADAAGLDPYTGPRPAAPLQVDLPLVRAADDTPIRLRAVVLRWSPVRANGTGDIAVLQLERAVPSGARMPPLRRVDELWDHRFRVLGFPEGQRDGVWSTGRIRGEQGTRWFQLQSDPGDQAIEPGFSGSPVWDEQSGAVVGMTVAADRSADTTTAYLIPIDQVLGLDPELLPCPYRGLEPFGEEHAAFFFGRDADIARLSDALARRPMVAVAGPSGVGKSSLVRAGLVPLLRESGAQIVEMRPGMRLDAVLASARQAVPTGSGPAVATIQPGPVLLVDQFEELAAADPAAARELLLQIDAATQRNGVRAVLTLRWESLAELTNPPTDDPDARGSALDAGSALVAGTVIVGPMDRAQLRDAVVGPAERAPGLLFEPGLVDTILDDAGSEPGQLPLVESLLTELWERRVGGALTVQAYRRAGGVAGAVAKRAEELLAEFPDHTALRRLFTQLTRPDREGRFVRRPAPMAELAPELRALLPRLVAGRLLVVSADGTERVELAHQALIEHWPRLRDWLTEDRDFLDWRAQLEQQRERWAGAGQDDGALLRGNALVAAQQWLPARAADVAAPDQDYVQRSQARQRREVRRWRVVTAVLAVLVLAAGGLAVLAQQRGNSLDERLRSANAENLGREALARAPIDPDLAARLALAAWHADPANVQARTALATTYLANQSVSGVLADLSDRVIGGLNVSAGAGVGVVAGDRDPYTVLSGLARSAPQRWVVPGLTSANWLRLSRDGTTMLTGGAGGPTKLWNVAARTSVDLPLEIPPTAVGSIQLAPTGDRVSWLGPAGPGGRPVFLWDLRAGQGIAHALPPIAEPGAVRLVPSSNPDVVLIEYGEAAAEDTQLAVRSVSTGVEARRYGANVLLGGGGALVVACRNEPKGPDGGAVVSVIDPVTGTEVRGFRLSVEQCSNARITADGDHLVETVFQPPGTDVISDRVMPLAAGSWRAVFVPPGQESLILSQRFQYAPLLAAVPVDGGGAVLLKSSGRSVLQLATMPDLDRSGLQPANAKFIDNGTRIVQKTQSSDVLFDPATGARLDPRVLQEHPSRDVWVVDGQIIVLGERDSHWSITGGGPDLPPSAGNVPSAAVKSSYAGATLSGDRIFYVGGGRLSVLDADTHERKLGPFVVGAGGAIGPPEPRPGRPDEVGVLNGKGEVELWNVQTGSVVDRLVAPADRPFRGNSMSFTRDGNSLVMVTNRREIEVWDMASRTLSRPPIPLPYGAWVVGVDADGYLLTGSITTTAGRRLSFWDLNSGRESGSMRLTFHAIGAVSGDGRMLNLDSLQYVAPNRIGLTAQSWYDHLCKVADRPFQVAELDALPVGFDPSSPCTRR